MRPKPPVRRLALPARVPFALALRRRPRLRRWLGIALALLVALSVAAVVRRAESARAAWGRSRSVVVATRDLPAGHVLGPGDTEVVDLPEPAVPQGAVTRVENERVVRSAVFEGEVLVRERLAEAEAEGVAALLPEGTRAVAVPIEPASSPPLEVGQLVDILGVVAADGQPQAVLLAAAAPVLEVGEHAVTVAVDPDGVAAVAMALAAGAITVAIAG